MKKVFIVLFIVLFSSSVHSEKRDENEIVWAHESDPTMKEAIKEARATLDSFLKRYKSNYPNVHDYKLKVMIQDENGTEHFWVQPFRPAKRGFEGILANEPKIVKNVEHGQLISFTKDMISDWGYVLNGKQYGSYTVCALFKSMPKEQVEYYRKNHGFQC